MKRLFLLLCLGATPVWAAPGLLEEGLRAVAAENYQHAIDLFEQAMDADPKAPEPARALAELYTAKGLHELALPVWQSVVDRDPGDWDGWVSLAQTRSYLDQNAASVDTLETALQRFPTSPEITQALAWMLFKTEQFQRGITVVEDYITAHGTERSLEMTLGTLYSSVFDYGLSRAHYLKSIELAAGSGPDERNFRSIAWYNLSLLEKSFYQFERADEAIQKSLQEENRPSGLLARGELYQGSRRFEDARAIYEKAVEEDETPLGRFDLARLLQQFGYLDEAEAQLIQVEHHKDETWIYNFGVTKDKVKRDLHELRADLHRSRYYRLDFEPRANPWDWLVWLWRKASEGLAWWYNDQSWKSLLVRLSSQSLAASNAPDAWVGLTLAHRDRPALGLKYLALVRNHELPKNPRSQGSYLVEEGLIRRDPALLEFALTKLQTPWENEDAERVLTVLAEEKHANRAAFDALASRLYRLNPASLCARGWGLPVRLGVFGDPAQVAGWKRAWSDYSGQTGWDTQNGQWSLDWRAEAAGAAWTLRDPEGEVVKSGTAGSADPLHELAAVYLRIHRP